MFLVFPETSIHTENKSREDNCGVSLLDPSFGEKSCTGLTGRPGVRGMGHALPGSGADPGGSEVPSPALGPVKVRTTRTFLVVWDPALF